MLHRTIKTLAIDAASDLLIYINHDTKFAACINRAGLLKAHDMDIAVGCHPYAMTTAWISVALLPTTTPAEVSAADGPITEDWLEWCDDVFAAYGDKRGGMSIASAAQETGVISDARFADEINASLRAENRAALAN